MCEITFGRNPEWKIPDQKHPSTTADILNIANEIVKRQHEFLENGSAFLKPMTMVQIAEAVGVHETTVSRAISGKYMATPQGVFDLKYFFTPDTRRLRALL